MRELHNSVTPHSCRNIQYWHKSKGRPYIVEQSGAVFKAKRFKRFFATVVEACVAMDAVRLAALKVTCVDTAGGGHRVSCVTTSLLL